MTNRQFARIPFEYVCEIVPELGENGLPVEYTPQSSYGNRKRLPLHKYGTGPFCRFGVPRSFRGHGGVYVILVDDCPKYVGRCEDLESRFNLGYGRISPRNCFLGGQPTNCRVNSLILAASKERSAIQLFFYETEDRLNLEDVLIEELMPEWNRTTGNAKSGRRFQASMDSHGGSCSQERRPGVSKYRQLQQYLADSRNQVETLSYAEIERILGFELPSSAYVHREWWANGGHSQAQAWMAVGWKVESVQLGVSVTFRTTGRRPNSALRSQGDDTAKQQGSTSQKTDSIPELLRDLHQLRIDGILTEEQFDEQKRKLLDRL